MRTIPIEWSNAEAVAAEIHEAGSAEAPSVDLAPIREAVRTGGDAALLELTNRFDAIETGIESIVVPRSALEAAMAGLEGGLEAALALAIENVRTVAEAQVGTGEVIVNLPQGHTVITGEVPVGSAAVYAPGGRKSYPSSVIMGAVAARAAGVGRVVLASPPSPTGQIDPVVLATASMCGVDDVYAVGGAQAIYALAFGTESIPPVDVIVGPGNTWVTEAKKDVFGLVGIDSPAGPSDLTVVFGPDAEIGPLALDLCAQAEHGGESPLTAVAVGGADFAALVQEIERIATDRPTVNDCLLFLVEPPSMPECLDFLQRSAPEHLELVGSEVEALAAEATTAGCVFVGPWSATAFGDYVAGSNHILPTGGSGRTFGPLSPSTFRRSTSRVILDEGSASALADAVEAISGAEGLPVHGLSARARAPR